MHKVNTQKLGSDYKSFFHFKNYLIMLDSLRIITVSLLPHLTDTYKRNNNKVKFQLNNALNYTTRWHTKILNSVQENTKAHI